MGLQVIIPCKIIYTLKIAQMKYYDYNVCRIIVIFGYKLHYEIVIQYQR